MADLSGAIPRISRNRVFKMRRLQGKVSPSCRKQNATSFGAIAVMVHACHLHEMVMSVARVACSSRAAGTPVVVTLTSVG